MQSCKDNVPCINCIEQIEILCVHKMTDRYLRVIAYFLCNTYTGTHTQGKSRDNRRMLFKKLNSRIVSFGECMLRPVEKGDQRLGRGPICSNNAKVTGRIGT